MFQRDRNDLCVLVLDKWADGRPETKHVLVNELGNSRFDVHHASIEPAEMQTVLLGRRVLKGRSTGVLRSCDSCNGGWRSIDRCYVSKEGHIYSWPCESIGPCLEPGGTRLSQEVSIVSRNSRDSTIEDALHADEVESARLEPLTASSDEIGRWVKEKEDKKYKICQLACQACHKLASSDSDHHIFSTTLKNQFSLEVNDECTVERLTHCIEAAHTLLSAEPIALPDMAQRDVDGVGHIVLEIMILIAEYELMERIFDRVLLRSPARLHQPCMSPATLLLSLQEKNRFGRICQTWTMSELLVKLEDGNMIWLS